MSAKLLDQILRVSHPNPVSVAELRQALGCTERTLHRHRGALEEKSGTKICWKGKALRYESHPQFCGDFDSDPAIPLAPEQKVSQLGLGMARNEIQIILVRRAVVRLLPAFIASEHKHLFVIGASFPESSEGCGEIQAMSEIRAMSLPIKDIAAWIGVHPWAGDVERLWKTLKISVGFGAS